MTNLIQRAREFATCAHQGQRRKYTGNPYIEHPEAVAGWVTRAGLGPEAIAAAWLHDVVEDCGVRPFLIDAYFGSRVAKLVAMLTDTARLEDGNRAARKAIECRRLAKASPDAQSVKLADLIDNTASIVKHDPGFARVYLAEKRALLEVLTRGDLGLRFVAINTWIDATNSLRK